MLCLSFHSLDGAPTPTGAARRQIRSLGIPISTVSSWRPPARAAARTAKIRRGIRRRAGRKSPDPFSECPDFNRELLAAARRSRRQECRNKKGFADGRAAPRQIRSLSVPISTGRSWRPPAGAAAKSVKTRRDLPTGGPPVGRSVL